MSGNHLDVPGASLYYETKGTGPLLLMIPGANGTTSSFIPVSQYLSKQFTVVLYDRRGFSRSKLVGEQDYDRRLETDADDASRLIQHLSDQPAFVLGSSSGAIVSLKLLLRHPSLVRVLIPHEPPAVSLLGEPDASNWKAFFREVYDTYRQEGVQQGMQKFAARLMNEQEAANLKQRVAPNSGDEDAARNYVYWFEHELRQYSSATFDVTALAGFRERLVILGGKESCHQLPYQIGKVLAEKLGLEVVEVPGGHVGYASHAEQFAQDLVRTLNL